MALCKSRRRTSDKESDRTDGCKFYNLIIVAKWSWCSYELLGTIPLLRARLKFYAESGIIYENQWLVRSPQFRSLPFFFSSKPFYLAVALSSSFSESPSPSLPWLSGAALSYSTIEYSTASYYGFLVTAAFYFARALRPTVASRDGNLFILIRSNLIHGGWIWYKNIADVSFRNNFILQAIFCTNSFIIKVIHKTDVSWLT